MESSSNQNTEPIHRYNAFAYFEALEEGIDFCAPTGDVLRMIEDNVIKELQDEVSVGWMSEEEASSILAMWMYKYHRPLTNTVLAGTVDVQGTLPFPHNISTTD